MLVHITAKNVDQYWDRMAPGISRALQETNSYKSWRIEDIYDQLKSIQAFGFYMKESEYSGVYSLIEHPLRNILYVFWGGQHPDGQGSPDYEELDAYLTAIAKTVGASTIQVEGRKGWERKVKHLGYSLDTINISKEVT